MLLYQKVSVVEAQNLNYIENHSISKIKSGYFNIKKNNLIKKVKNIKLSRKKLENFLKKDLKVKLRQIILQIEIYLFQIKKLKIIIKQNFY